MMSSFLSPSHLLAVGPQRFNVEIQRMLWHLGFDDVRVIDGPGDGGGDLLATRGPELFVFQNKWTTRGTVDRAGVDEVERAKAKYSADRAVLVSNAMPSRDALERQRKLARVGIQIEFWTSDRLSQICPVLPGRMPKQVELRPYQQEAVSALLRDIEARNRALLILATGLGKTVVGGEVINSYLSTHIDSDVLVVAHMKELVGQLERALWRHLPKQVKTQVLTGAHKPPNLTGLTCATVDSALSAVYEGYKPGLVMVDETHHVSDSGLFQRLLDLLSDSQQFGVTATPWRGDLFDISGRFGPASFKMGIAEGMNGGYLSQVDYRLLVDNIDWNFVSEASLRGYSIHELNKLLFLPQRDEAMLDHLTEAWSTTREPRAIVFCQTIEHAEHVRQVIARHSQAWKRTACIHSKLSRREREVLMADFRLGRVPIIVARDILNEGVDVPDVNIICFLRVTHSRRIFVQQLGRGLRLSEGKDKVLVLDFATDIRRIAAALELRRALNSNKRDREILLLPDESTVTFSNEDVGSLMDAWIRDAADLEIAADEVKLQFPDVFGK